MKVSWKGAWRGGEITIETENTDELISTILKLQPSEEEGQTKTWVGSLTVPSLSGNLTCSEAIRHALLSNWGRVEPRTMAELQKVFEDNALFFSKGTLSGVLTYMTRSGQIRRLEKDRKWSYVLVETPGRKNSNSSLA